MNKAGFHILRVGVAITFLWIGILIFRDPVGWGSYLQPWAAKLLFVPIKEAMIGTAILDIVVGGWLLFVDRFMWIAAALASAHLIIVLVTSGITDITVRDIGLLAATVALLVETLPFRVFGDK
ncbi:MAG: hypothetical protein AAB611_03245 [Patescibacteria group bacterium]